MTTPKTAIHVLAPLALGLLLSTLGTGCDTHDPDALCLPEDGCDGIAEIIELDRAADVAETSPSDSLACPGADTPEASYVAQDPQVCAELEVQCEPGWTRMAAACGCGCQFGDSDEAVGFRGGVSGSKYNVFGLPFDVDLDDPFVWCALNGGYWTGQGCTPT